MKAPRGNQAPKIKAANPEQELGSPAPQEEGKVLGRELDPSVADSPPVPVRRSGVYLGGAGGEMPSTPLRNQYQSGIEQEGPLVADGC